MDVFDDTLETTGAQQGATSATVFEQIDALNAEAWDIRNSETRRALDVSMRAVKLAEAHSYERGLAYSLRNSCQVRYLLGEYNLALTEALKSLSLFEKLEDRRGIASTLNSLINIYDALGEAAMAVEAFAKSSRICGELGDNVELARALANVGNVYFYLADYAQALDFLQQSVRVGAGTAFTARPLLIIGNIYTELGDYEKALDYFFRGLQSASHNDDGPLRLACLANLSGTYTSIGDYESARDFLQQTIEASVNNEDGFVQGSLLIYLGELYRKMGEYGKAFDFYHQALRFVTQINHRLFESHALLGLGELLYELGEEARAIDALSKALAIAEEIGHSEFVFKAHHTLSQAYERRGEFERALTHYKSFYEYRQKVFGEEADKNLKRVMMQAEVEKARQEAEIYRLKHVELAEINMELEKATRAKSEFLANISHEIRTPLNAIIGMTGLLLDSRQDTSQREFTEVIRASGESLLALINEVLDFSKIEAGKLDLENRPFELRECVEAAADLLALKASEKGLALVITFGDGIPHSVVGDLPRLRQILVNLIDNAVKFTHEGEVVVSVEGRRLSDAGYELQIAVKDTGIGIPADGLGRLFRSFSQVDGTTTRQYGGTGLGLVICKRLAELMGGRMWVESRAADGATFCFTSRCEIPEEEVSPPARAGQQELSGRTILIAVENDAQGLALAREAERWGISVRRTSDEGELFSFLAGDGDCDAAVVDLGKQGNEQSALADRIRALPHRRELPLVMLAWPRRQGEGVRPDGVAFLAKPVKVSALHEVLMVALNGSHSVTRHAGRAGLDRRLAERLPLRILLAEDTPINQKVTLHILEHFGYRADVAANGLEVLYALQHRHYDLILMDVQMPEMDGLEATRWIRDGRPGAHSPRVIAMTASATVGDRERCMEAGMDDFLSKPVRPEDLCAVLSKWGKKIGEGGAADSVVGDEDAPRIGPAEEREPAPAVDLSRLLGLRDRQADDGGDIVGELVSMYIRGTPAQLASIREALAAGDMSTARRQAHALRGSCANMGLTQMSSLSEELEAATSRGLTEEAARILSRVEAAYRHAAEALAGFAASASA